MHSTAKNVAYRILGELERKGLGLLLVPNSLMCIFSKAVGIDCGAGCVKSKSIRVAVCGATICGVEAGASSHDMMSGLLTAMPQLFS